MKAVMSYPSRPTLITDIFVPEIMANRNRKGYTMDAAPVREIEQAPDHHCYEHGDTRPHTPLRLSSLSTLPTALYAIIAALPAWSPKTYTLENGVKTNWKATLPSRQMLTNAGVATLLLFVTTLTVWALPQKNAAQVIAERPIRPKTGVLQHTTPQNIPTTAPATTAQSSDRDVDAPTNTASTPAHSTKPSQPESLSAPTAAIGQTDGTPSSETPVVPPVGDQAPTDPATPVIDPPSDPTPPPVDPPAATDPTLPVVP